MRGKLSGLSLSNNDAKIVLGMQNRGDRENDIAAWFGVNQGRVAEVKAGSHGALQPADQIALPPAGPPGVKGRRLRGTIAKALDILQSKREGELDEITMLLADALKRYDTNEG